MIWEIFLIANILIGSLSALFARLLMKEHDSNVYTQTIIFLGLEGLYALILTFFLGSLKFPTTSTFPNLLFLMVVVLIATVLTFKAYQLAEASEVIILMSTQIFWTMLTSFIFLKEPVTLVKILGGILIFSGVSVAIYKKAQFKLTSGVYFALLAAILWGFQNTNGFFLLQSFDVYSFQVYACFLPMLLLIALKPLSLKRLNFYLKKENARNIFFLTFVDLIAILTFYLAYQTSKSGSLITPLALIKVLLAVILAAIFLKERDNLKNKVVGAFITALGAFIILLK